MPRSRLIGLLAALVLGTPLATAGSAHAIHTKPLEIHFKDGFYFGLGVGYAAVSGTRGVPMETYELCSDSADGGAFMWVELEGAKNECVYGSPVSAFGNNVTAEQRFGEVVRTDVGSGLGLELRFGWNILGYVSPELSITGHGAVSGPEAGREGMVNLTGQLRIHPIQFWIPMAERPYDATAYIGFGLPSFAGYHPDDVEHDEGKGWSGINYTGGASFHWMVSKVVSLGLDVKLIFPRYLDWIVNFDNNWRSIPTETPGTTVVLTSFQLMLHL